MLIPMCWPPTPPPPRKKKQNPGEHIRVGCHDMGGCEATQKVRGGSTCTSPPPQEFTQDVSTVEPEVTGVNKNDNCAN